MQLPARLHCTPQCSGCWDKEAATIISVPDQVEALAQADLLPKLNDLWAQRRQVVVLLAQLQVTE